MVITSENSKDVNFAIKRSEEIKRILKILSDVDESIKFNYVVQLKDLVSQRNTQGN